MNGQFGVLAGARFRQRARVAACTAILALAPGGVIVAQGDSRGAPPRAATSLTALHALDTWVVTRFREVHLLPDSTGTMRTVVADVPSPRVESVGDAASGDTVYALHFAERRDMSALRVGARVRLTAPSGSITSISADIVARRPFRAPRVPGADTASAGGWRYGWAYLAIVRRQHAATSASVYRGWLLLDAADADARR